MGRSQASDATFIILLPLKLFVIYKFLIFFFFFFFFLSF
ncbi:hypothetical protein ACJIZ3_018439 [Penstemon smallii]|uniref:Uncharacterized protein n=1 Tax=Penstemon smallii TaxID=265156 RepID=A0ABD3SYC0_9LAMI